MRRKKDVALSCITKDARDTIVSKLKGTFKVPIKQRTSTQKKALILIRRRKDFSLNENGKLVCHGKEVIVKEDLPKCVETVFKANHGCGARTLYNKLKHRYTGFTEGRIIEILHNSEYYHRQYPRFTNKPVPKTVKASSPGQRWQIDIMSLKGFETEYENKIYKYILQICDVYSRFIIPQPLTSKRSSEVALVLENVFLQHGAPKIIQCDNGLEFQGISIRRLLEKHDIKMVHGRPYHPQSQGKCERSNQTLRRKITFRCRMKEGFNWVSGLQNIAHSINTLPKRVLGNMTPFEVYFRRNNTSKESLDEKDIKDRIKKANKSFRRRQIKGSAAPSKYVVGEKVLIRYPFAKSRVPSKRYILDGKIVGVKSGGTYLVEFVTPKGATVTERVRVDNITSLTYNIQKQKQQRANKSNEVADENKLKKKAHKARFYKVLEHEDNINTLTAAAFQSGAKILFDPKPNGNCQFAAISHQLQKHDLYRDESVLRYESVEHLRKNKQFYESFVHQGTYENYIQEMLKDGTYGDNLTLIALMREYNMQCLVLSTAGPQHSALVSNDGLYDDKLPLITLGYFPEYAGMHYVSIDVDSSVIDDICDQEEDPVGAAFEEYDHGPHERDSLAPIEHPEADSCDEFMTKASKQKPTETTYFERARNILIEKRRSKKKGPSFPFMALPQLVQEMIIDMCIKRNPSERYVLEKVNGYFADLLKRMGIKRPKIYVSPSLIETVPNPVSVRYFIRNLGRNSGVVMEIKNIIREPRWPNAWLRLRATGIRWYDIVDIYYSK